MKKKNKPREKEVNVENQILKAVKKAEEKEKIKEIEEITANIIRGKRK